MARLSTSRKHHAKKSPPKAPKRTLAEKRRRGTQSEASAARANRPR